MEKILISKQSYNTHVTKPCTNKTKVRIGKLGAIITQIHVYLIISSNQIAKTLLKFAVFIKFDQIAENS